MRKLATLAASLAAVLLAVTSPVWSQGYPSKQIRIVVPFGPGTNADIMARIVGQGISQALGQPVVIDNKPGADGAISGAEVARAAPDGYTILLGSNSALSVVPHLQKQPPYDARTAFTPISFIGNNTFLIVVHPSVPARSLPELIAYAKANPKKINYASGNTTSIVSTALLAVRNDIQMLHVPYKSEGNAMPELLSGQVHMILASLSTVAGFVKDGKLHALATLLPERTPLMPEVPSIVEAGQPKFEIGPWGAIVGPAKMPAEIVKRLNTAIVEHLAKPETREQLQRQGIAVKPSTPEELGQFLEEQLRLWGKALKDAGLEAQ